MTMKWFSSLNAPSVYSEYRIFMAWYDILVYFLIAGYLEYIYIYMFVCIYNVYLNGYLQMCYY